MEFSVRALNAEVLHFLTTANAYTIFYEPYGRMDVARCTSMTPDAPPEGDFWCYMWVQSVQGFFVLHQPVLEGKAGTWSVIFEIVPAEFSAGFFSWVEDHFWTLLPRWAAEAGRPLGLRW